MENTITIFRYQDLQSFLAAYVEHAKKQNPRWTYTAWAKKLGLSAPASITMILNGKRKPGPGITTKLIEFFNFNERERLYFLDLIRVQKSLSKSRNSVHIRRRKSINDFQIVDDYTFQYISNWFFLAIREMTHLEGFQNSPFWIASNLSFPVSVEGVQAAIQIMLRLGLLSLDNTGNIKIKNQNITTSNDRLSSAIQNFHNQMLENAKISLSRDPVDMREITASTLCVRRKDMSQAKAFIREFLDEFESRFEVEQGDAVYQFNVQFFPLTKGNLSK